MVVLFPLLLVAAAVLAWQRRSNAGGKGMRWFLWWTVAGSLMTFSFLTGFTIGLFALPAAAAVLMWVAMRAPHVPEALGFLAGVGTIVLLVVILN